MTIMIQGDSRVSLMHSSQLEFLRKQFFDRFIALQVRKLRYELLEIGKEIGTKMLPFFQTHTVDRFIPNLIETSKNKN